MLPHLLLPVVLGLQVLLAAPSGAAAERRPRVAQVPAASVAAATTDRTAADMARLQRRRAQKLAEKRQLERTYELELAALDRLKRGKASWRRDRQIRSAKAASQTTAERLSRADIELRAIDASVRRQRQALLAAVDRELATGPGSSRRAALDRMRGQVAASLRQPVRKILIPDETLDELADPEQLGEQVALIQQAEAELRRERESLQQRESRYARMSRLRDQRDRAVQMSELDDEQVRRTGGRPASRVGASTDSPSGAPPSSDTDSEGVGLGDGTGGGTNGGSEPTFGADSGFEQSSILLADVVDTSTVQALRRAGRSASPRARAEAAAGARAQVEARLNRLARSRLLILRHLRALRRGE